MSGALSSAKSYASTSGNTSVPVSSSLSPGLSFVTSSMLSDENRRNARLGSRIEALIATKPRYYKAERRAGDIFFHCEDNSVGHTNMTCIDTTNKVDSVDGAGVRIIPLARDKKPAIVFRFCDADIAQRAALLAEGWANTYNAETRAYGRDGVGYSGGPSGGIGVTGRVIGALLGSSKFGTGAKARLMKYRNRVGQAPRHVICSEMAILAYQLCMAENDNKFIKLDAKHALPSNLFAYMLGKGTAFWSVVAYREGH